MLATVHIETLDTYAGRDERHAFLVVTQVSAPHQALALAAETLAKMPDGGLDRMRLRPLRVVVTFK